ncbi:MAG: DUF502 domain-containing protein [Deltaproteobacteria bacterium]|nr:DUF502 domain-containing protein [Deltaproteobacteria bacterium]NIS76860.1 DUF502 domain-containing protein [Deltaproteobacteria bacterium]
MKRIREIFRKYFFAGLFSVIPIALSVFFILWFFRKIDALFSPVVYRILQLLLPGYERTPIPGTGFVLGIIAILLVGFLSKTFLISRFLDFIGTVLKKIPLAKSIYSTLKTLTEAFSPENMDSFREVVLVRYPRTDSYAVGFLTKKMLCGDDELIAVYVPTNNLYLGDVLFIKEEDMVRTRLSVEEGMRVVASGGTAAPDYIDGGGKKN